MVTSPNVGQLVAWPQRARGRAAPLKDPAMSNPALFDGTQRSQQALLGHGLDILTLRVADLIQARHSRGSISMCEGRPLAAVCKLNDDHHTSSDFRSADWWSTNLVPARSHAPPAALARNAPQPQETCSQASTPLWPPKVHATPFRPRPLHQGRASSGTPSAAPPRCCARSSRRPTPCKHIHAPPSCRHLIVGTHNRELTHRRRRAATHVYAWPTTSTRWSQAGRGRSCREERPRTTLSTLRSIAARLARAGADQSRRLFAMPAAAGAVARRKPCACGAAPTAPHPGRTLFPAVLPAPDSVSSPERGGPLAEPARERASPAVPPHRALPHSHSLAASATAWQLMALCAREPSPGPCAHTSTSSPVPRQEPTGPRVEPCRARPAPPLHQLQPPRLRAQRAVPRPPWMHGQARPARAPRPARRAQRTAECIAAPRPGSPPATPRTPRPPAPAVSGPSRRGPEP